MKIENLTDDFILKNELLLPEPHNATVYFDLFYQEQNQGWYWNLAYKTFKCTGNRLVLSDNILINYKNLLPFIISCKAIDGIEPVELECFITNRIELNIEIL